MKTKSIIMSLLALALVSSLGLSMARAGEKDQAKLEAKAKITKTEAEKTATAKVPDGKVKEAELEEEHGKLVWSFDFTKAGSKDITEVQVDAITGKIVNVEIESPKDQAKEVKEDSAEGKKKD